VSVQARYIAVEGPIGAGKTSLARRLGEHLGYRTLLEDPGANPFLPGFYEDPARYAFQTQLHFLLQRIEQLSAAARGGPAQPGTVADFVLDKDPLFAELNLAPAEWALYRELYRRIAPQAPAPELVVYLQATPAVALERVRRRRIGYERGLALDYLTRLADAFARFFLDYAAAPLLVVNADHLNFVDRDSDFELLLQRIRGLKGPREYFSLG
jgi:deoxyadenosine/deoxycytidine kinase